MKPQIKIAVIGGTGKAGKYLVTQLINQGYHFKVLVRDPERFTATSPLAEVITGNVSDYNTVRLLLQNCNVVISTLGMGIPASEPTIFSTSTKNILRATSEAGIRRYIVVTGLNVDTPKDEKSPEAKAATQWMYANYPLSTTDKQREYDLLAESNSDWTMVRLPMIEQTGGQRKIAINLTNCPGNTVSAASLANFLISQVTDESYIRQAPFIANI